MKFTSKLFPGSVFALMMGVFLASPLLMLNNDLLPLSPEAEEIDVGVSVDYAYFNVLPNNPNVAGISRTETSDCLPLVAYLFVLNITNYSNVSVDLHWAGVIPQKGPANAIDFESENFTITPNYPIISKYLDFANMEMIPFDKTVEANQSRLIAVSGVDSIWSNTAFETLKTGKITIKGQIMAKPSEFIGGSKTFNDIKEVQLTMTGNEYTYNQLVSENQKITIFSGTGIDVRIESEP